MVGFGYNVLSLDTVGLSKHFIVGNIAQLECFTIGTAVLHGELAWLDKVLSECGEHARVLAPCDVQCQEQCRRSIKERIVRPVDCDPVKAASEVVLRGL